MSAPVHDVDEPDNEKYEVSCVTSKYWYVVPPSNWAPVTSSLERVSPPGTVHTTTLAASRSS